MVQETGIRKIIPDSGACSAICSTEVLWYQISAPNKKCSILVRETVTRIWLYQFLALFLTVCHEPNKFHTKKYKIIWILIYGGSKMYHRSRFFEPHVSTYCFNARALTFNSMYSMSATLSLPDSKYFTPQLQTTMYLGTSTGAYTGWPN